jgi:hypothetical protein
VVWGRRSLGRSKFELCWISNREAIFDIVNKLPYLGVQNTSKASASELASAAFIIEHQVFTQNKLSAGLSSTKMMISKC